MEYPIYYLNKRFIIFFFKFDLYYFDDGYPTISVIKIVQTKFAKKDNEWFFQIMNRIYDLFAITNKFLSRGYFLHQDIRFVVSSVY